MPDEKKFFLVGYEYGMGGLWGGLMARSEDEIRAKYPELGIVHQRPEWMTEDRFEQICKEQTHDIDEAPTGIVTVVLADREKREK